VGGIVFVVLFVVLVAVGALMAVYYMRHKEDIKERFKNTFHFAESKPEVSSPNMAYPPSLKTNQTQSSFYNLNPTNIPKKPSPAFLQVPDVISCTRCELNATHACTECRSYFCKQCSMDIHFAPGSK
jgi:hypothetical protein